ncbi:MAG: metal-dependent transcriptional regulator [Chloroflexi bacterium]|nr:metal-dependent transcriptional regulator [Chloroflexota bacterium]MCH8338103.1 metal-dependent transcriptional regulator [Chloroflexota bacterium]
MASNPTQVSSSMAHYLGVLYRLGGDQGYVISSAVAADAEVSAPAAARMFRRLEERGLVDREPYKGVRLTAEGEREALREIRTHRLSEAFLVRVMGYGWHEAHDLADGLAEIGDDDFADRMEEKAGFPTRCPHGEPIPTREGKIARLKDRPLTELENRDQGVISRVRIRDPERLQYLASEGLVPETHFRVVAKAPFGGPIRLGLSRREVVLGAEIAGRLYVELAT